MSCLVSNFYMSFCQRPSQKWHKEGVLEWGSVADTLPNIILLHISDNFLHHFVTCLLQLFFGWLWNFLSIFSNVLTVIVSICGLIEWFLYKWENSKFDYPCFQKFSRKQPEFSKRLNKMFDLLYEVVKSIIQKENQFYKNIGCAAANPRLPRIKGWGNG